MVDYIMRLIHFRIWIWILTGCLALNLDVDVGITLLTDNDGYRRLTRRVTRVHVAS
jgi:hypothetical protein